MVKTVTWAGEATKFFKKNKGKDGMNTLRDVLKSSEFKKQYELVKKGGVGDGEDHYGVNDEATTQQNQEPPQYDGGNEIVPEPTVMDGGNDDETPTPQMDGGKRKKSARRTKKSKKSKTVKKQRKHKK